MISKTYLSSLLTVLIFLIIIIAFSLGCLQQGPSEEIHATPITDKTESVMIPEEFIIYQDYIEVIGDKPQKCDIGTIEATVISLTQTEVCPDKTDPFALEPVNCSIEPYPKDIGTVSIDRIINYTPFSEQTSDSVIDQPGNEALLKEGNNTQGYEGPQSNLSKKKEYDLIYEGQQEVDTIFLLTTRPAIIRYVPVGGSQDNKESMQESSDHEQDIGHDVTSEEKVYKPIPKSGIYYIFTTKIGNYPDTIEKTLPGLEVGSRFRAEICYDGSLYIEEYEILD